MDKAHRTSRQGHAHGHGHGKGHDVEIMYLTNESANSNQVVGMTSQVFRMPRTSLLKQSSFLGSFRILRGHQAPVEGVMGASVDGDPTRTVTVLAATNLPWDLDEAMRRRLEKRIYIPLPSAHVRRTLLDINLREIELDQGVNLNEVADKLQGYSGADITNVCRDAAMMPFRRRVSGLGPEEVQKIPKDELLRPVTLDDFLDAIRKVNKSVSSYDVERQQTWMEEFGAA
nr:hypothetical protein BaRGS_032265 [Batillaria attramentaria]